MIAVAAGVLTFGSISVNVDDALAAKTGGRIGGQSFRSSAPRPSSPRINNNNSRYLYISTNSYSVSSFQGNLNIVCWILTLTQLEEECCILQFHLILLIDPLGSHPIRGPVVHCKPHLQHSFLFLECCRLRWRKTTP
jgi:hypothetical protein